MWWATNKDLRTLETPAAGEVLNGVSRLESIDVTALLPHQKESFRRMLGEAVARLLDSKDVKQARSVLKDAREYIAARHAENARRWYLAASGLTTLLAVTVISVLLWGRNVLHLGDNACMILLGLMGGALGALLSILLRSENLARDISSGKGLYQT